MPHTGMGCCHDIGGAPQDLLHSFSGSFAASAAHPSAWQAVFMLPAYNVT